MVGLRDKDVHFAVTRAKPLPKFVAEDLRDKHGFYTRSVLFRPETLTEAENVDGTKVSGYFGLRGTVGLYIEQEGRKIEATTAAREFIEQLRSLVEAMKTSPTNP